MGETQKPPDMILMPRRLTAENGAKGALMGEFHVKVHVPCLECHDDCEECTVDAQAHKVVIPWPVIKDIYRKAVDHFESQSREGTSDHN